MVCIRLTVLRWVLGLALALWPVVAQWIVERVKAPMVYVDEKWLKLRGRWHDRFVVLYVHTELPVLAALLPSRSQWACRWVGRQLRSCSRKYPRSSSRMDYRLMPTWRQARKTRCVAFITSRV